MSEGAFLAEVGGPKITRARESSEPLLTPFRMGDLDLPNRVIMTPVTRMRANPDDHVPTIPQAEYYAQRASAGLIIAGATAISPEAFGWADTPGLWNEEQVRGWSRVTDAVHAGGGRIIAQLRHTGAMSHPELRDGLQPVSASDVDPHQLSMTRTGRKPTVTPRPLTKHEIQATVADFGRSARNALVAGFDGVQILANYLYLISQFLNAATNLRKDEYGGSLENRSRFLFEVDFSGTPLEKLADDGMFRHFRPIYKGTLIANVNMHRERGNRLIAEELTDLIAFGRTYIANPDLVQRFAAGAPLAEVDWETVYGSGSHGYSDYPIHQPSQPTIS
jgi:2,4-dienoyl-CoA reductase-like NADH-dependent reductase (Old Yellow Enzyme family)